MPIQSAYNLTANEIKTSLANMFISQDFFDRIGDSDELVDKAKVDGTLYGDTKLFYAADVLASSAWGNDAEATNLLSLDRPADPKVQAIKLDTFRQIRLTLDDVLSKRAFSNEGAFGQFQSLMEGMIGKTKRIYDVTTYNAFIGCETVAAQTKTVSAKAATEAQDIAKAVGDLLIDMTKVSRDYNEYGHVTKFGSGEIKVIWNANFVNKVKSVDLPTIYHDGPLAEALKGDQLPAIYFGTVCSADVAKASKVAGKHYRALVEQVIGTRHYFPGDELHADDTAAAGKAYVEDDTVIAKVYVKLPPIMSAFEVGTSFFNPRSLTTNRYLTWGHNTLKHFEAYPCITLKESLSE